MDTIAQIDLMLTEIQSQEDVALATLNKLAGARDALNHLRTILTNETLNKEESNNE